MVYYSHHHSSRSTYVGCGHVIEILQKLKGDLSELCMHKPKSLRHTLAEVEETTEDLWELKDSLHVLFVVHGEKGTAVYLKIDKTLHDMCGELEDLEDELEEEIIEEEGAMPVQPIAPPIMTKPSPKPEHGKLRERLREACVNLKVDFSNLLEELKSMGAISHDTAHALKLYSV